MARIRTIKPEFPESESMGRISRDARLLFIMLWLACDDEGKTRGHSRKLASTLYPYDEDAPKLIDRWLMELERENVVIRYQVDGSTYLKVVAWAKHQKIDKPSKSRLPDPQDSDGKQPIREHSRKLESPPEGRAKHGEAVASVPRTFDGPSVLYLGPRTKDSEANASEPVGSSSAIVNDPEPSVSKLEPEPVRKPSEVQTPFELEAQVWAAGKAYLQEHGLSRAQAGALVGRWRKLMGHDDLEVMRLLRRAQAEVVSDPVAFIQGCINAKGKSNGKGQFGRGGQISDHPLGVFAQLGDEIREAAGSDRAADYPRAIN